MLFGKGGILFSEQLIMSLVTTAGLPMFGTASEIPPEPIPKYSSFSMSTQK